MFALEGGGREERGLPVGSPERISPGGAYKRNSVWEKRKKKKRRRRRKEEED